MRYHMTFPWDECGHSSGGSFMPTLGTPHSIQALNSSLLGQNGRHFADDTFKCILLNENIRITIKISLKFVPKGPINNIPALVQIMVWRRPGNKPFSEPMMVSLLTHICVTRPQWVNVQPILYYWILHWCSVFVNQNVLSRSAGPVSNIQLNVLQLDVVKNLNHVTRS